VLFKGGSTVDLLSVFISTFLLVFIGELGDKTQIAAGTGTLANRKRTGTIFISSVLALVCVSGLTVFGAGLIPSSLIPTLTTIGGGLLIIYGIYLFRKKSDDTEEDTDFEQKSAWGIFFSQFFVVFMAELGDKTQIATLAAAIENQTELLVVFAASAGALIAVTSITVWGVTKIPTHFVGYLQRIGAVLMVAYGVYMLI
jgi:putative Ca2+/H+ antiporter (TMEM165/GDT1 family)